MILEMGDFILLFVIIGIECVIIALGTFLGLQIIDSILERMRRKKREKYDRLTSGCSSS